jgi:hypothetical protein
VSDFVNVLSQTFPLNSLIMCDELLAMWFASCPSVSLGYCGGRIKAIFVVDVIGNTSGSVCIVNDDNVSFVVSILIAPNM